ncbi:DUF2780 domain-containing protein [Tautonia rosea]|uniref:DUF2780 domain-containing protein n=1 Tax=Tautonia rosea TaxID=2728037 RepID=UPI001475A7D5|nr:DUF2780 domain-containing protein [Tautonia rosea]
MSDFISQLQSQTGLDGDLVKKGVGAILNFMKEHLPEDLFTKVESEVPQAADAVSSFLHGQQASGMLEKVGDLVGGLLGGKAGALPDLLQMLSKTGLSLDQAKTFLPIVIEKLKDLLPDDVLNQIMERLPAFGEVLKKADG